MIPALPHEALIKDGDTTALRNFFGAAGEATTFKREDHDRSVRIGTKCLEKCPDITIRDVFANKSGQNDRQPIEITEVIKAIITCALG